MIKAINSIWKNLLFDFLVGLILIGLLGYNLSGRRGEHLDFASTDIAAIVAWFLLCLHILVLLLLTVINIVQRAFIKAIVFIATGVGLFFGLRFIGLFLLISTFGGPPIDEGNRFNFQKSELCKQFDTTKIKTTIENLRLGIYSSQLDSGFIQFVKQDTNVIPMGISKIICGCRKSDTTIVIFRIWDKEQGTFELEMTNNNGHWSYSNITPDYFEE